MKIMHWTVLTTALFLLPGISTTQTIHKDDLKYFRGMIPHRDLLYMRDTLCISSFYDWEIARPDTVIHNPETPDSMVLTVPWFMNRTDQRSFDPYFTYNPGFRGHRDPVDYARDYHIYILSGDIGGLNPGILTRWEPVGDSLRFICGKVDDRVLGWVGLAAVRRVIPFPDSSLLVVIKSFIHNIEGGDISGTHRFLRVTDQCSYESIFSFGWSHNYSNRHVNSSAYCFTVLDNLVPGNYRVTKVTEWYTNPTHANVPFRGTIDSVTTEVVDLWKLAVEKFDIDTTVLDR